jgi:branched-chain amino acid transport system ATP-binding protein
VFCAAHFLAHDAARRYAPEAVRMEGLTNHRETPEKDGSEVFVVKTGGLSLHDTAPYRPLLLRAVGVSKQFGALVALEKFDFEVPRHSIVSVIGPNGSGKTVFFKILTGLHRAEGGIIWFNGREIDGLRPHQITELGIIQTFQGIRVFANMTVLENVLVGRHCHLHSRLWDIVFRTSTSRTEEAGAARWCMELLDFVGLADVAHMPAKNLSYGAQRRVEVARALASDPQLLLLDEPTAGMNPQETAEIMALVGRLRRERGLTIVLVEHDMKVVMGLSDRVTVLDHGIKVSEGSPAHVRSDPRVIRTYLGMAASGMSTQDAATIA